MPESDDDRILKTPNEARAGATGHNVRYVLMVSLILAIIAMIVIATLRTH